MGKSDAENSAEPEKNPLDKEIEKSTKEKTKIEENIKSETKSAEETATSFSEYVKTENNRFDNTLNGISSAIKNFREGTDDFLKSSKSSLNDTINKFTEISEHVIKRLYLTLIFFAGIFFASYFYLNGFKVDAGIASGLITIIAIFILIYKSSRSFSKKIIESQSKGIDKFSELQTTAPRLESESLKTNSPFGKVEKELIVFDSSVRRILGSVRDFIPVLEKLYSGLGRHNRQNTFAKTLQNALLSYRIPLSSDATDYLLNRFGSLADSEMDWIDEASKNLAPFTQIDPRIIKLCYFDYMGDSANLKNSWNDILSKPGLLGQLTQVLLTYVIEAKPRDDYEGFSKLVSELDPFSLSSFEKAYYSFYFNLDRKKRHLINSMIDIHIKVEDIETRIKDFIPKDPDEEKWEQELIEYSSKLLNLDSNIISLFYYDRIGNYGKRKDTWTYLKSKKNDLFNQFIQLLIDNKLLEVPDNYRNNKQLGKKISQILDNQSEFDFFSIRQSVYAEFKMIDGQKKSLIHALDDHGIHFSSSKTETDFESFIPMTTDYLSEISEDLASKLSLDKDFVLLFYGSNYDKYLMDSIFKKIREKKKVELAGLLVDKNLIKTEKGLQKTEEINNIALILGFLPEFNLVHIQNFYQNYVNLLEVAKKLVTFMGSEELTKKTDIDFKKIVDILPEPNMPDRLDSINKILRTLLDEEKLFENENMDVITIAILCVFLVNQEDVSARRCCQRAQQIEISSKILYHNMMMKDESTLRTEKFSVLKVIRNVISDPTIQYQFLADFRLGLANGYLYQSTKDMASKKIQDVKEQMGQVSVLKEQMEKMQSSFREFLNTELPYDFMEYAINSQIIQAYMISSRSQKGIFTEIVGERMQKICKEISRTDATFKDLLIMGEPKEDQFLGKSTRIGVVPLGMDFDEFSKKFYTLFDKTVEDFILERKSGQKSDFSVNIFRILASPTTFKRIKLDGATQSPDQDDPIQIIRNLIVERFSVEDSLSLVATSKEGSVKKLIEIIVDERGKLYSLLENDLRSSLNRKEVLDLIKNKDFDKTLYEKFDCTKFTDLAKKTYQIEITNDANHVKSLIQNNILQIFQKSKVEISDDESKILSNMIYRVLNTFGTALTITS